MHKISIHPLTWLLFSLLIITGYFRYVFIYFTLLLVHEMGHFLTATFFGWETDKIYLYPYGGFSKFNEDINRPMKEEFLVFLMGPIFQIGAYLVLKFLGFRDVSLYHYAILLFNLLPIYPLDGGKLLHLFFAKWTSYRRSYQFTMLCSYVLFFLLFFFFMKEIYSFQWFLLFLLLFTKLTEEYRKRNYYYQKFLLERYLKKYHFKKRKQVTSVWDMMRDKSHLFYQNGIYYSEQEILKDHFEKGRLRK